MRRCVATLGTVLFIWSAGSAQQPSAASVNLGQFAPYDSTTSWHYPYEVSSERRQQLVDALNGFHESSLLHDLVQRLGRPDRIEDLAGTTQPLSHFEQGFVDGSRGHVSYRFIWFARKLSKSPGISDSFLVAYVGSDTTKVVALHGNWLK